MPSGDDLTFLINTSLSICNEDRGIGWITGWRWRVLYRVVFSQDYSTLSAIIDLAGLVFVLVWRNWYPLKPGGFPPFFSPSRMTREIKEIDFTIPWFHLELIYVACKYRINEWVIRNNKWLIVHICVVSRYWICSTCFYSITCKSWSHLSIQKII